MTSRIAQFLDGLIELLWSNDPSTQISISVVLAAALIAGVTVYLPLRVDSYRKRSIRKKLSRALSSDVGDKNEHRDIVKTILDGSAFEPNGADFIARWSSSKDNKGRAPVRFASTFADRPLMPTGWRRSLLPSIPGIFLALGILGTFVGLTLALNNTGDASAAKDIGKEIDTLISSLSLAFRTSLWGISLSIAFVIGLRRMEGGYETEEEMIDLLVHEVFPWISDSELSYLAIEGQRSGTDQLRSALQEVSMSLENAITSGLEKIEQSTSSAANDISQELIETLANALQEGVGAHVEALRVAIAETTSVQQEIGVSLALAFEEIRKATEAHSTTARSLDEAATAVETAAERLSATAAEFGPSVDHLA